MTTPAISIITPTTGEPSLRKLLESLYAQLGDVDFEHIVLWDGKRHLGGTMPSDIGIPRWCSTYNIEITGEIVQGIAAGSALRSIGLMASKGKYVTFADSDVWHEPNHLKNLIESIETHGTQWAFCRRKIWNDKEEYLGVDNFESVGKSPESEVPYNLVDNNTMIFKREFGTSAAVLYRETKEYNDDRLMTEFLYKHAGTPTMSLQATVNQICPERLENMFKEHCTK